MPELPDVMLYLNALEPRVVGHDLCGFRLQSPFLLRTVDPAPSEGVGRQVASVGRIGKRIVMSMDNDVHYVVHPMIAGRFSWAAAGAALDRRSGLAAWDFEHGTLLLREASKKKRAALHVVRGADALTALDPGGIDVLATPPEGIVAQLRLENRTLKRALTDARLFDGIGNAYSDEILFEARLSPIMWTSRLSDDEALRLATAMREVLERWIHRLRDDAGDAFPDRGVTAFRPEMAVHGRFREPCRVCGTEIQRVRYAERELNYCPRCQTDGRLLADRALSRLLKKDWPRTIEELEQRRG